MWTYESIFYQIYPIGFCGAPIENDHQTVPRIRKLIDWSNYLKSLGINAVLLNPIFDSDQHGYDTRDFKTIDCRLGTNTDFIDVVKEFHKHGIRIVLDGVFNHVGRGFWAFQDVLKNREASIYKDWFHIDFYTDNGYHDRLSYRGWEGHYELVELNLQNSEVADYLLSCVSDWITEFDIDGLRLDVAYSLDHDFMRRLRTHCTDLKKDFALIGEVLFGDYNVIVNDTMLHSCTNYECYKGLYSSLNDLNLFEIAHSLNRQFGPDDWCIYRDKHLMTFADNHDVERLASILHNKNHLPLAYSLLFAMPGIPCLYYGSEWGTEGKKEPDNDFALRPCFDQPMPNDLTEQLKTLIQIRQNSSGLCYGGYKNLTVNNQQLLFERSSSDERILICLNISDQPASIWNDALNGDFCDLLTGQSFSLHGSIELSSYTALYLK